MGREWGSADATACALGELLGNGRPDLYVTTAAAGRVWANRGVNVFADSGQLLRALPGLGVALGDLDGGGGSDAFAANDGAISSDRLEQSGWWRRLEVRLHLLMCLYCRRYAAQIRAVNAAARGLLGTGVPDRETAARLGSSVLGSFRGPGEGSGRSAEPNRG